MKMREFLSIIAVCAVLTAGNIANADETKDWVVNIPESAAKSAAGIEALPAKEEHLLDDKIYFFAHSMCKNCKDAFVHIYTYHGDLGIPITDMKFHHNFELYKECVQKFNIPNKELRLPLICMGDNFIMGWNEQSGNLFEQQLTAFKAKNAAE